MSRNIREKFLEYAAGFFVLVFFAAIFLRLIAGDYLLPLSGFIALILFMMTFSEFQNVKSESAAKLPKTEISPETRIKAEQEAQEKSVEIKKLRTLIHTLAESKGIEIKFLRHAGSGHVDSPEQWKIEQPIPLTPEELYKLTFFKNFAQMAILPREDILYAHRFYFLDGERVEYNV